MKRMQHWPLEIAVVITWLFTFYAVYCAWDLLNPPFENRLVHVEVVDAKGEKLYESDDPDQLKDNFVIRSGMSIIINFKIDRHYNGVNYVERVVRTQDKDYMLYTFRRVHTPNNKRGSVAVYEIPTTLVEGCDNWVYSRNTFVKTYNVLTYVHPYILDTHLVRFCFKR